MGYGSYSLEAHQAIVGARDAATMRFSTVFDRKMNPLGVKKRESRDSEKHPNSIPIVFALDVSTSMGDIPRSLATKTLPTFMQATLSVVPDPQVLFMAFMDARYTGTSWLPLQVGQFESRALGAPAVRVPRHRVQPHHQRAARGVARGLRHLGQAARDDRMGMNGLLANHWFAGHSLPRRTGGAGCKRPSARHQRAVDALPRRLDGAGSTRTWR